MTEWWEPAFQTTIDAFYEGRLDAGRDACERLLSVEGLPAHADLQTRRNLVFYAPRLAEVAPSARTWPIEFSVPDGWSRFNPSVAADPESGRLRLNVRSSNYEVSRQLQYTIHDDSGVIRTTNYLLDLAPDLAIASIQPLDDLAFRTEPPPFPVSGFEDCRLFTHCGSWWVSATVRDRDERGMCQITLLELEGAHAVALHVLSDGQSRHEKNWMPVQDGPGQPLRFVYSSYPTVILRFDDEAGSVAPELIQPGPPIARRFSGGAQAVPVDGGWLCLVHEAVNYDDWTRVYTHRWVWFDAEWRLARLSAPFIFADRAIEFASGLARHGDDLVVSYGVWDREAWLATVPLAEVLPLLAPPRDPGEIEAEMRAAVAAAYPAAAEPLAAAETPAAVPPLEFTPFPVGTPSIASTTLTGNSRDVIADALRSVVDWVDWCLVIDTGVIDDTLEVARAVAGDKLVVRPFPWRDDFSAARNFALGAAAELGADWAVTIDTDERLDVGGVDVRAALAATDAGVVHIKQVDGTYGKERLFRLPVRGRFVGPTHEAFNRECDVADLDGVFFRELGKSHEQYRQKAERDVAILSRHTAENPDDPRWYYYLGDSLAGLGRHDEAVAAFRVCAGLKGWDEEGAWAMYRAAESLLKLDRPDDAVEACAAGLARHAGLGELAWLAGYASWQAGRPHQTAYWARHAIALGHYEGAGASVPRMSFRYPAALWELPYDLLRYALRAIGNEPGAAAAERKMDEAKAAREQAT